MPRPPIFHLPYNSSFGFFRSLFPTIVLLIIVFGGSVELFTLLRLLVDIVSRGLANNIDRGSLFQVCHRSLSENVERRTSLQTSHTAMINNLVFLFTFLRSILLLPLVPSVLHVVVLANWRQCLLLIIKRKTCNQP